MVFNHISYTDSRNHTVKYKADTANNIKNVKLIGFDINTRNVNALKEGYISHLIAERPEYQGYMAIKAILEYLIYNKKPEVYNYTPIDIIINETVDFYTTTNFAFAL